VSGAPLYGLVLAGGRSTRMQRDKAGLDYGGKPQLVRAMEVISPLVTRAFVSVRAGQQRDPLRAAYDTIADLQSDLGPLAGIQAALRAHPDHAWLVLACDLPFLDQATLRHLIAHRAPGRLASAYRSRFDGLPEPLCGWLARNDVELLDLPAAQALDNVNTAEEYAAASSMVGAGAAELPARRLNVRYFALLREQAGRSMEALQTQARTPQELYRQLQRERGLTLAPQYLRVAVNDEFGDWQQPLAEGDTVAFLPPVAGG
jgi:molybdopterin-guanine dinucleotide biosynthesis protein A